MTFQVQRVPNTGEQVLEELRRRLRQSWTPGTEFTTQGLAAELKVSRTPVRHAIEHLLADGLLALKGVAGGIVRRVENDEFFDVLCLRRAVEIEVALKLQHSINAGGLGALEDYLRSMEEAATDAGIDDDSRRRFEEQDAGFHCLLCSVANFCCATEYVRNLLDRERLYVGARTLSAAAEVIVQNRLIVQAVAAQTGGRKPIFEALDRYFLGALERRAPHLRQLASRWAVD